MKAHGDDCSKNSECQSSLCDKKSSKCVCDFGQFYKENATEPCIPCKFIFRFADNLINFLKCF